MKIIWALLALLSGVSFRLSGLQAKSGWNGYDQGYVGEAAGDGNGMIRA